jgi:excisionase family DNA binding protein
MLGEERGEKRGWRWAKKIRAPTLTVGTEYGSLVRSITRRCAMSDEQEKTYLTREEAARYIRVGLRSLDYLRADGTLRACRPTRGSDKPVFRKSDLDAYMQSRLEEPAVAG